MIPILHLDVCRGRYECCKALLRAGADPNYINKGNDLTLFWGIDGGVEIIKLMHQYGVNMDARTPKDWTPLSYCKAKGKYGPTEEKGIYPEVISPATIWRTKPSLSHDALFSKHAHMV